MHLRNVISALSLCFTLSAATACLDVTDDDHVGEVSQESYFPVIPKPVCFLPITKDVAIRSHHVGYVKTDVMPTYPYKETYVMRSYATIENRTTTDYTGRVCVQLYEGHKYWTDLADFSQCFDDGLRVGETRTVSYEWGLKHDYLWQAGFELAEYRAVVSGMNGDCDSRNDEKIIMGDVVAEMIHWKY
jgi:hypothetical protein